MSEIPNYAELEVAAGRLKGVAIRTPLMESALLNRQLGVRLLIKPECLQLTGSFKVRGAYNKLLKHVDLFRRTGIVAYSGGNHAQGAAYAAAALGIDAIVLMPSDAPPMKIERTRAYGATVQLHDRWKDDRDVIAAQIIADAGRVLVPSFDDADIIAGQGTVGLEISEQCTELGLSPDVVLIPCGGGGLSAGTSLALKTLLPSTTVLGVEPEQFDDTRRSLLTGARQKNSRDASSICDSLLTQCGELTLSMNKTTLDGVLTVSDAQVQAAMQALFIELKLVTEPGGAVAAAAVMFAQAMGLHDLAGKTVVAIVSGGNVEKQVFADALRQPALPIH
jgi:threonine dehydratase